MMTQLSIITINLNNAAGLRKTIESVVSQTFTDFEYIVIDGGSTDGSVDVINEYADKITYWVSEPDNGIYSAMNKGILQAKGEYLNFLNSGDWYVDKDVLINGLSKMDLHYDFVYGDILYSEQGQTGYPDSLDAFSLIYGMVSHQAIFHHHTVFKNELYNENLMISSDWEFFIKKILIDNCSSHKINLTIAGIQPDGISSNIDLLKQERQQILTNLLPKQVLDQLHKCYQQQFYSLYPYMLIFAENPKLQRIVRGFMKLILLLSGKKELIPTRKH